jgi:predicted Zn-dependent protease
MPEGRDASQREELARRVLELSTADQTEVLVTAADSSLTRFSHEMSHQNVAATDLAVSVRAILDGRTGVATTNRTDEASLRDVVDRALEMARLAPSDPLVPVLPRGGAEPATPNAFDGAAAGADAGTRATMARQIFDQAEGAGLWCAGYVSSGASGLTVANTSGALSSFEGSDVAVNVKMNGTDSTGFAEARSSILSDVDAARAGRIAAEKALDGHDPRSVEPGEWTVILEPAAFGELFVYLADHFSAQTFDEGSSYFSEGLDRPYFCDTVDVRDDWSHPLQPGMPFDYEGQPTQQLPLVERGVVRNIVTDSYYANKLARPNTGHALPAPNAYGPQPRNLVVGAGTKPFEQLVAETKRGLLVSRFWYIRTVDKKRAIVTGMTRDGTFLIEDGEVRGGVRNLRFNQSIIGALSNCEFSSSQTRTGSYHYSLVAPHAKIAAFNFTSTTEF